MQQKKCENDLKKALKDSNDKAIHAIYAKQVGQCRKMKARLLTNKVKMNGMMYSIESMFSKLPPFIECCNNGTLSLQQT